MQENTVQTLIDSVKDLTGQTNVSNAKAIRALNYGVDDYTRQTIKATGRWRTDSANHENISRITAAITSSDNKLSLPVELIAIRQVEVTNEEGNYVIVKPTDIQDHTSSLSTDFGTNGRPQYYDIESRHMYLYPTSDTSRTVRVTYSRAHPRFSATNLTQKTGVMNIDDMYVVLYAANYLSIGSSDSARASIKAELAEKKQEVLTTFGKLDQDKPRKITTKANRAFTNPFKNLKR